MTNVEQIESALQVINSDDRDNWLKIGMAINSEIGDSGFYLWDKWSQSAENYDQRDSESVWKSFTPGGGVNVGSLFHLAKQNGWSGAGLNTLSQAEVAQQKADLEAKNKLAVAQKAKKQQQTAGIAQQLWRTGNSTPSKYLKRKQVEQVGTVKTLSIDEVEKTIGYRPKTSNKKHADNPYLEEQLTLVPVVVDGKISTIEMIDDKGRKSALKDGAKSGGYWAAQTLPEGHGSGQTFLVGEGVATVLSCQQATGGFAIAALSCHNLILVARQIKERYTDSNVVILSDLGNGQKAATDAAQAVNGLLAVPVFPEGVTGTDFNDLAVAVGLDEVKRQIETAAVTKPVKEEPQRLKVIDVESFLKHKFPPRENILAPWLPAQGLAMVYAPRGIGKTHFSLGVAYAVASGGTFLQWTAEKPRGVLFIDGEMPGNVLQERISAIAVSNDKEPTSPLKIITPDLQPDSGMLNLSCPEDQRLINPYLAGIDLIIVDNLSTLCRGGKESEGESWLPVQQWALQHRAAGRSVLFIHHAGKNGEQRGTSRREDVLDTVINLKRPGDYTPDQGACFEVHFEKARGLYGDETKPFEAKLITDQDKHQAWCIKALEESTAEKVAKLIGEGVQQTEIAEMLGITKGAVSRAKKRATDAGLMTA